MPAYLNYSRNKLISANQRCRYASDLEYSVQKALINSFTHTISPLDGLYFYVG